MTGNRRDCKADLALISFVALVFRALHLFFWSKTPYFTAPSLDELFHHLWASSIARGIPFEAPFFRAPFYPYFLGFIYRLFGEGPWIIRVVQGLIGVSGCWAIYFLAQSLYRNRRSALAAGIILALSPMPALFESRLLLDFLLVPLTVFILLFAIESTRRRPCFSILLGLSAGLFAVTRPNILAVFPLILGWLFYASKGDFKPKLGRIAFALFGLIVAIAPVAVHNFTHGSRALIATQGGLNLYLGNNPATDGITPILPGFGGDWTLGKAWRSAELEAGTAFDADELDRYYRRKAFAFFRDNPRKAAGLMFRKVLLFASGLEHGNNGSPEFFKRFSPALRSPFGWRFLLPTVLFLLPLLKWDKTRVLLALFFVGYSATVILFFVNARFRLPLLVPMICLVAVAASGEGFVKSRLRIASAGALLILGLAVCCVFPAGRLGNRGLAESYFALGNLNLRNGFIEKADSLFALSIQTYPEIDRANLNRGIVAFRQREFDKACVFLEREAIQGKRALALSNLGVISRIQADTTAALDYGSRSIEPRTFESAPFINYAQSLLEFGHSDSAVVIARAGLEDDSLNPRLLLIAGAALMKIGEPDSAVAYLSKVASALVDPAIYKYELSSRYSQESAGAEPDSAIRARAFYNLGLIMVSRGKADSAEVNIKEAIRLSPDFSQAKIALGTLYENTGRPERALELLTEAIEQGERSAVAFYNRGLVRAQLRDFNGALNDLRAALELDSTLVLAGEKIVLIEKLHRQGKILLE